MANNCAELSKTFPFLILWRGLAGKWNIVWISLSIHIKHHS